MPFFRFSLATFLFYSANYIILIKFICVKDIWNKEIGNKVTLFANYRHMWYLRY